MHLDKVDGQQGGVPLEDLDGFGCGDGEELSRGEAAHPATPFGNQAYGAELVAVGEGVEIEGLVDEVVGPERGQVGERAEEALRVGLPVGVEGGLDEQHDVESGAVGALDQTPRGAEHGGAVGVAVERVEAETHGVEAPGGDGVEVVADRGGAVVVGGHHLQRVAHAGKAGLVVEHQWEPGLAVEDEAALMQSDKAVGKRRQRVDGQAGAAVAVAGGQGEQEGAKRQAKESFHF